LYDAHDVAQKATNTSSEMKTVGLLNALKKLMPQNYGFINKVRRWPQTRCLATKKIE
jgi:hypothetical protein